MDYLGGNMSDYGRYIQQEVNRLQEENRELREEVISLRQYIDSIQSLMEAVEEIDPKSEIMPLLDRILYNAMAVINASDGSLLVTDDETGELVFVLAHGRVKTEDIVGQRIPPGKGIAGWVAKNKKPTIVNNTRTDDRFYSRLDEKLSFETRSIVAAPIVGGNRVLGVIEVLNKKDGKPFNQTDQTLLQLLCRFAGEILNIMIQQDEEKPAEKKAQKQQPVKS